MRCRGFHTFIKSNSFMQSSGGPSGANLAGTTPLLQHMQSGPGSPGGGGFGSIGIMDDVKPPLGLNGMNFELRMKQGVYMLNNGGTLISPEVRSGMMWKWMIDKRRKHVNELKVHFVSGYGRMVGEAVGVSIRKEKREQKIIEKDEAREKRREEKQEQRERQRQRQAALDETVYPEKDEVEEPADADIDDDSDSDNENEKVRIPLNVVVGSELDSDAGLLDLDESDNDNDNENDNDEGSELSPTKQGVSLAQVRAFMNNPEGADPLASHLQRHELRTTHAQKIYSWQRNTRLNNTNRLTTWADMLSCLKATDFAEMYVNIGYV